MIVRGKMNPEVEVSNFTAIPILYKVVIVDSYYFSRWSSVLVRWTFNPLVYSVHVGDTIGQIPLVYAAQNLVENAGFVREDLRQAHVFSGRKLSREPVIDLFRHAEINTDYSRSATCFRQLRPARKCRSATRF